MPATPKRGNIAKPLPSNGNGESETAKETRNLPFGLGHLCFLWRAICFGMGHLGGPCGGVAWGL